MSDELNLEKNDKSPLVVKRWDWKDNVNTVLEDKKIYSPNHLHCYLDKEKNNSKVACYYAYNSYKLSNIFDIDTTDKVPSEGIGFIYSKKAAYKFLGHYQRRNYDYVYMDNSYFSKLYDVKNYKFRLVVNHIHPQIQYVESAETDIKLSPWRQRDDAHYHILLCPPTNNPANNILKSFGLKRGWLYNTIKIIRQKTNRRICIRFKNYNYNFTNADGEKEFAKMNRQFGNLFYERDISETDLLNLFENCYAVVAPASGVGVIAASRGIPVFSEKFGPVGNISLHDYSLINEPIYPDRTEWMNNIINHEFILEDVYTGKWLTRLKKMYPLELENILDERINLL